MRKIYRYKNLSFAVSDDTDVNFEVEFNSKGNVSQTVINIPGPNDTEISNSDTKTIGKGKDLRDELIVCFSDVENPLPEEDEIKINYKINGKLMVEHTNLKSEEERPIIILSIKFPKL